MKYKRLFTPIKIGNVEIKNRVLMPAMSLVYTPGGFVNEKISEFYWRRAEGGVGLIIVGGAAFDPYGSGCNMLRLDDDKYIPGLKTLTDGVHARGAKIGIQLYQTGRYGKAKNNNGNVPIAPSAVYSGYSREMPREMTKEDIHDVIERAAEAAKRAAKAGFDLVEIIGSAGYLICQFLSPLTNLRTDEYGGSWENRIRFPVEMVREVRKALDSVEDREVPLTMRISGHDLVTGSNNNADAVEFAKVMEAEGIAMLNITGGWHESKVPQITGDLARGGFDFLAAAIKDAVNIPVAVGNRISDPDTAERILALGEADMVSVGRPHIADPDWVKKSQAERPELIRSCLGCNQGCLARCFFGQPAECLVNGQAGREFQVKNLGKVAESMKILVIGGGAAGCEFAIRAAERGNEVTIWEKSSKLGGQVNIAAVPPHKSEFLQLVRYHENMLNELGITVIFNKTADADAVTNAGFDMVVVATGRGEAVRIPLDNRDDVPVYFAEEILTKKAHAGRNVLVIGGGTVGCETAHYLACDASVTSEQVHHMMHYGYEPDERIHELMNTCRRKITVLDMDKIGKGFDAGTAWPLMQDLKKYDVKKIPFAKLGKIENGMASVDYVDKDGAKMSAEIPCDTVVLATGAKRGDVLYEQLRERGVNVRNIGDSEHLANVIAAIQAACSLAESL